MVERDTVPGPLEADYRRAALEAPDAAAAAERAARRDRVLAAVRAASPAEARPASNEPRWRPFGRRAGWGLAVAAVAGLSAVLVLHGLTEVPERSVAPGTFAARIATADIPSPAPGGGSAAAPPPATRPGSGPSPTSLARSQAAAEGLSRNPSLTVSAAAKPAPAPAIEDATASRESPVRPSAGRADPEPTAPADRRPTPRSAAAAASPVDALASAVRDGNVAEVRRLIEQGAAVNGEGSDGRSALAWAVLRRDPTLVDVLVRAGADPDRADRDGQSPRRLALALGDAAVLARLPAPQPATGTPALPTDAPGTPPSR
jgi:hypothetical protein